MAPEPTFDETIDKAVRALAEAAAKEVDRKAVAEKIESPVRLAQLELFVRTHPAPRSDTRKLFKTVLKRVQQLQGTLKNILGKEHRVVLISAESAGYAELPTIGEEVDAANELLPREVREDFPAIHLDVAESDFVRFQQELARFEQRWGLMVNALDDMKHRNGRPSKEWKTRLIHDLATVYEGCVDKKPPHSNRGRFVELCRAIFEFLEPGKPHQAIGDTVKKALESWRQ